MGTNFLCFSVVVITIFALRQISKGCYGWKKKDLEPGLIYAFT